MNHSVFIGQKVCHQSVFFSKARVNRRKLDEIGVLGEEREIGFSNGGATFHCSYVNHKLGESIDIVGIKKVKFFVAHDRN